LTVQLHDFNGGIQPSGLFWIVQVPDDALEIEDQTATLNIERASVLDDFQFFAPASVPATVSYRITWTATGPTQHFQPQSSDPTDPTNFAADFRPATATITFSASELGFSVTGTGTSEGIFAEMGRERNGLFLQSKQ
jgi:hypothetical protein